MSNWTPAAKRWPPCDQHGESHDGKWRESKPVLVREKFGNIYSAQFFVYDDGTSCCFATGSNMVIKPVEWMEIPE